MGRRGVACNAVARLLPVARGLPVAAALALLASPALAAPRFVPDRVLSPLHAHAVNPAVAVSGDGRGLVAWDAPAPPSVDIEHGKIEARLGRIGRRWSATQVLSRDGGRPKAAMGRDGTAAVAWVERSPRKEEATANGHGALYVSVARPGHRFGRPRLVIGAAGLSEPLGLEVQPTGVVVLVWSRPLPVVELAERDAIDFALVGRGTSPLHVARVTTAGSPYPEVSMTEDGAVLVRFMTGPVKGKSSVPDALTALAPASVSFSPPQLLTGVAVAGTEPASMVAPPAWSGRAAIVVGAGSQQQPDVVALAAERQANGTFGPFVPVAGQPGETLEPRDSSETLFDGGIVAALPADGSEIVAWQNEAAIVGDTRRTLWSRVMASVRPLGAGAFGTPAQLSSGVESVATMPHLVSAGRAGIVLWTVRAAGVGPCKQRVYAAVRPGGGVFARATPVSNWHEVESIECFGDSQLAVAGSGRYALAAWLQNSVVHVVSFTG